MSFVGIGVTLLVVVASVADGVVSSALMAVVELVMVIVGGDHHCRGGEQWPSMPCCRYQRE